MNLIEHANSLKIQQNTQETITLPLGKNAKKVEKLAENSAAIIIQTNARKYLDRQGILSNKKTKDYKILCDNKSRKLLRGMPRAKAGFSSVFLPPEYPEIVLKKSILNESKIRLNKMQEVRKILDRQNASCLIVPKAINFHDFLVEEKLPININIYHNLEIYINNTKIFDKAVREMVNLFSEIYLADIVNNCSLTGAYGYIEISNKVRYDNLPLFLTEKDGKMQGCVGLVDLEQTTSKDDRHSLQNLARIFPRHLAIIKQEAEILGMEYDEEQLKAEAAKGELALQKLYIEHVNWLKSKDPELNIKNLKFKIETTKITELEDVVAKKLLALNGGKKEVEFKLSGEKQYFPVFLKGDIDNQAIKNLASEIVASLIENLLAEIDKIEKEYLANYPNKSLTELSEAELISLRSPEQMNTYNLLCCIADIIFEGDCVEIKRGKIYHHEGIFISEELFVAVLDDLVLSGELYHYNPYSSKMENFWIRF